MINNLYLKKFAGSLVDSLADGLLSASNFIKDHDLPIAATTTGVGALTGYLLARKRKASTIKKLLSALGGAGVGFSIPYGIYHLGNSDLVMDNIRKREEKSSQAWMEAKDKIEKELKKLELKPLHKYISDSESGNISDSATRLSVLEPKGRRNNIIINNENNPFNVENRNNPLIDNENNPFNVENRNNPFGFSGRDKLPGF